MAEEDKQKEVSTNKKDDDTVDKNKKYKLMYPDSYGSFAALTDKYFQSLENVGLNVSKVTQINNWLSEIATIKHGSDFGIYGDDGIPSLYYDLPELADTGFIVYLKPDTGDLEVEEEGAGIIDSMPSKDIKSRVAIEDFLTQCEQKAIKS